MEGGRLVDMAAACLLACAGGKAGPVILCVGVIGVSESCQYPNERMRTPPLAVDVVQGDGGN
jgi:hypothetical protein